MDEQVPTAGELLAALLRRGALAIADYYRTLDPLVALLLSTPGVLPAAPRER